MTGYEKKQVLMNFASRTNDDSISDIFYSTTQSNREFSIKNLSSIKILDKELSSLSQGELNYIIMINKLQMLSNPSFEAIYKYKLSRLHIT